VQHFHARGLLLSRLVQLDLRAPRQRQRSGAGLDRRLERREPRRIKLLRVRLEPRHSILAEQREVLVRDVHPELLAVAPDRVIPTADHRADAQAVGRLKRDVCGEVCHRARQSLRLHDLDARDERPPRLALRRLDDFTPAGQRGSEHFHRLRRRCRRRRRPRLRRLRLSVLNRKQTPRRQQRNQPNNESNGGAHNHVDDNPT
jgi:hypothetical protein